MIFGNTPFAGMSPYQIKASILYDEPEFPRHMEGTPIHSLITSLLNKDPKQRLSSATEIKQHPFF